MGARPRTTAAAAARPGAGRLVPLLAAAATCAACLCPGLAGAGGAAALAPPEPELRVPASASEKDLDALPPGDPRRVRLLVDLALRRHAESLQAEQMEERDRADAAAIDAVDGDMPFIGEDLDPGAAVRATPHADALRAEAVSFALRAEDEGPGSAEVVDALIVGGLDADRIGRGADAVRLLGLVIRRHAGSRHAGDAWLALGERHLRRGDLTRARAALEQAARIGRPAVRAWAEARRVELDRAVSLPAR
jgi:hypothetical protein